MKKVLTFIGQGVGAFFRRMFPTLQSFVVFVSVVGLGFILLVISGRYIASSEREQEIIQRIIFSLVSAPFLIVVPTSLDGGIYPKHWGWFRRVWTTLAMASVLFLGEWLLEDVIFPQSFWGKRFFNFYTP